METRRRILDATRSLIVERGLEGTTIKAICDRAGALPGSFYNLFDSKEQAILTVVREAIDAVDPDPDGSHDRLSDLVEAFVRFIEEAGDLARIYLQIAATGGLADGSLTERLERHHRRRVQRFADALRHQQPEISADLAERRAQVVLAALTGLALASAFDPSLDLRTHADALISELEAARPPSTSTPHPAR